jgi:predicted dehydrogenase
MNKVRFGFIGAGKIAGISAAEVNSHTDAKVVAVQDLSQTRLDDLASKHDIAHTFTRADDLLACEEVDAVYIAVPNKFHAQLAIQALEAGKHVILEKPFAMNLKEAEQVVATARTSGRAFTLGMNMRFVEAFQKIKAIADAGSLGDIYHGKAYWFRRSGIPKLGTWFGNREQAGAGAINDIGVHFLDVCLHLMNNFEPASVSGVTYTKFGNRGLGEGDWGISDKEDIVFDVDDFASALIKMKNGASVHLEVTWACRTGEANRQGVELFGTDAGALIPPGKVFKQDPDSGDYQSIEIGNTPIKFEHCNRFHNFINHLLGREELALNLEQALVVQKILDAVSESSRTGREVIL